MACLIDMFAQIELTNLISFILVLITVTATIINYLFFRSQTEPNVLVHATSDETRPGIIILIIENVGSGLARDVKFRADKSIPEKAYGTTQEAREPAVMKSGSLVTGIPSLGPGGKRVVTWGQYFGLLKGIGDDVINIEVTYKSKRGIFWGYKTHKVICPVDICSFEGTDAADRNWDKKLYQEVSSIGKTFKEYVKNKQCNQRDNDSFK